MDYQSGPVLVADLYTRLFMIAHKQSAQPDFTKITPLD
jgi:hypothetical protein